MLTALAIFSCCMTFIEVNSAELPICWSISAAAAEASPFKAKPLALSRFRFLPVSNSASNSSCIDDSKSNKPAAIDSACWRLIPNFLACTAALAIASPEPPRDNFKEADILFTSFNIVFSFTAILFLLAYSLAPPKISLVLASKDLPFDKDNF